MEWTGICRWINNFPALMLKRSLGPWTGQADDSRWANALPAFGRRDLEGSGGGVEWDLPVEPPSGRVVRPQCNGECETVRASEERARAWSGIERQGPLVLS